MTGGIACCRNAKNHLKGENQKFSQILGLSNVCMLPEKKRKIMGLSDMTSPATQQPVQLNGKELVYEYELYPHKCWVLT